MTQDWSAGVWAKRWKQMTLQAERQTVSYLAARAISAVLGIVVSVSFYSACACAADGGAVRVEGLANPGLSAELLSVSSLSRITDMSTFSDEWLRRKADADVKNLLDVLRAAGFHSGSITAEIRRDQDRRIVVFVVRCGPQFLFDAPEIVFVPPLAALPDTPVDSGIPVKAGAPARSQDILDAEKHLLSRLHEAGYPFAAVQSRKVLVDPDKGSVHVRYEINPGGPARFGPVRVEGLNQVKERVVLAELRWKEGDPYAQKAVDKTRNRLLKTNLFSMVEIEAEPGAASGSAAMRIAVVERKPRSVALGVQYRTDEGPGMHALWEHRNLRGLGRRLELQGDLSAIDQALSVRYEMPRFLNPDQTLSLGLKAANDSPDAYDSRAVDTTVWLERRFGETLTAGGGLGLRYSHVRQQRDYDDFLLGSLPLQAVYDGRNDRLNPTSGVRTMLRAEPWIDLNGSNGVFLKNDWSVSATKALYEDDWVLAARLRVGMISGEGLQDIPADIRFYAGGGGSIRGFGYQMAGKLDCDDNPIGGRSLAEWTLEMRKRITDRIGLAAFIDGGGAFSSSLPDFSESLFWGGGFGLRYFTPVGPIRFDVAAPLNPRGGIDSAVQFYVSVGQAF